MFGDGNILIGMRGLTFKFLYGLVQRRLHNLRQKQLLNEY